jgi:ribonuclease-3
MEALIGAIYLDRGPAVAHDFVSSLILGRIEATAERLDELDFKTTLQELIAGSGLAPPVYEITEQGPDHEKHFFATVSVGGETLGSGEGRSKRAAEQDAAAAAARELSSERGERARDVAEGDQELPRP